MALTQAQKTLVEKAQKAGGGELGVSLDDAACMFLAATIIKDLGLEAEFKDIRIAAMPPFFTNVHPASLKLDADVSFLNVFERLVSLIPDADTYFSCLSTLQKTRIKYARILECQPIPTMDQVGPRSLLQYGQMSPKALAGFLLWRKWMFDIDNRAGQETGYLFEPIIASAIGGFPASSTRSPVRRTSDKKKGRQVDCIKGELAYEIKIRVTIAASGQGRWQEELDFPKDCRKSGFTPVLVVLDPTSNPKLDELVGAFKNYKGVTFVGAAAWAHLEAAAGGTMSVFLDKYVKQPITEILAAKDEQLPVLTLSMDAAEFSASVDGERFACRREPDNAIGEPESSEIPNDVSEG